MKKLLLAFLLSACGSDQSPDAEKKVVSLDLLGIMHEDFPCEKYLKELEDATEINLGYLAGGTFGESRICLREILSDGRLSKLRVHLTSWPCVRNDRCHSGETLFNIRGPDDRRIPDRIKAAAEKEFSYLAVELRQETRLFVSPSLEHEISPEVFGASVDDMLGVTILLPFPVTVVENSLYPRESPYLLEVHNEFDTTQLPYIYSTDGYMFDPRVLLSLNQDALIAFEWRPEFNGLCIDGSPWVSPLERRCW
jgi:hypothetical protein